SLLRRRRRHRMGALRGLPEERPEGGGGDGRVRVRDRVLRRLRGEGPRLREVPGPGVPGQAGDGAAQDPGLGPQRWHHGDMPKKVRADLGKPVDSWFKKRKPDLKAIADELHRLILAAEPGLKAEMKWGMLCYSGNSMVCALMKAKA